MAKLTKRAQNHTTQFLPALAELDGCNRMYFPGRSSPVFGIARPGIFGHVAMFEIKQHPAFHCYPATQKFAS
jgi:hypothetical protein